MAEDRLGKPAARPTSSTAVCASVATASAAQNQSLVKRPALQDAPLSMDVTLSITGKAAATSRSKRLQPQLLMRSSITGL